MRRVSIVTAVVFVITFSLAVIVNAGENKIGAGCQAVLLEGVGVEDILQGGSVRGWVDDICWEGNIYRNSYDEDDGSEGDLWMLTGKAMFATKLNEKSRFYLGVELGFGELDVDNGVDEDYDVLTLGPLFGAEYSLQGLPELGFHWEIGYKLTNFNNDDDFDISGIQIALGVHYYF
ncbi:MAG: hypothetical protein SWO11_00725 [Thermodesulfobacteriota bacterium]|nr:hypothetical protein [Thermodesulfobacteriota bacterium]